RSKHCPFVIRVSWTQYTTEQALIEMFRVYEDTDLSPTLRTGQATERLRELYAVPFERHVVGKALKNLCEHGILDNVGTDAHPRYHRGAKPDLVRYSGWKCPTCATIIDTQISFETYCLIQRVDLPSENSP